MATVEVRDVPDEVAAVIGQKASAEHKSVSAYLRDLMAADVKQELQRRAIAQWDRDLKQTQAALGLSDDHPSGPSSTDVVREIREQQDRGDQ